MRITKKPLDFDVNLVNKHYMKCYSTLAAVVFAAHIVYGAGSDGQEPRLGLVFPADQLDGVILTTSSLWLAPGAVISEGTQVVNVYMMPKEGDSDVEKISAKNRFKQATADKRGLSSSESAQQSALRARAERGVIKDINQLRGLLQAMDRLRGDGFFVYKAASSKASAQTPLNPPYGALFAQNGNQQPQLIWVRPGSLAETKGLSPGDKLTAVNGKKITNLFQADAAWRERNSQRVSFEVMHKGSIRTIDFGSSVNLKQSAVDSW